jgi:hypothetical protein
MHSSKALRQLTESDDPRLREIGFKLLQRGTGKFKELLYPDKPLGRALGSLLKKGIKTRAGELFTGKPDPKWFPDKEFSAMRLGGIPHSYDVGVTHFRSGEKPNRVHFPDRDIERLELYSEKADPTEPGYLAHTHVGGGGASPQDAAFFSGYPNVNFPIVETPRKIEKIFDRSASGLGLTGYGVKDPFKGPYLNQPKKPLVGHSMREFETPEAADEFRRSFGGGTEVPENWQGTLDQYRFGEIEAGKGYDSPGPSAFRRAALATSPNSQAGLRSMASQAMTELQKRFPNITLDRLWDEIRRVMQAKQAENYPENIDYTYHATDPEMFQETQKVVEDIGGGALSKLKLPE